jgi:methylmalonyl-CoA mutase
MYQRGRIQEESLFYEHKKHTGELPIVGVNSFRREDEAAADDLLDLMRGTEEEKRRQLEGVRRFQRRHADASPEALKRLQAKARASENLFAELMASVRVCSLGQITEALFEVGGQYRRNM